MPQFNFNFDWDAQKAASNFRKHGISFERATTIFRDPEAISVYDRGSQLVGGAMDYFGHGLSWPFVGSVTCVAGIGRGCILLPDHFSPKGYKK